MSRKKKFIFKLNVISVCLLGVSSGSFAEGYFNTKFLDEDSSRVADITKFISSGSDLPPGDYSVDVYLNKKYLTSGDYKFIYPNEESSEQDDNSEGLQPCLTRSLLDRFDLVLDKSAKKAVLDAGSCINITKVIPSSFTKLDTSRLRLDISVPQALISSSVHGYIPPSEWDQGVSAALLNYSLNADNSSYGDSYFLNLIGGVNFGEWRLKNNSTWNYTSYNNYKLSKWNNVSTYLQRDIIPLRSQLQIGDSSSSSDIFDSNSFRGVRLYSDSSMNPDSMQGYAPTVRGIARSDARIIVRQNGYIVYQANVPAGPFEIKDIMPQNNSGDLDVTIEDDAGSIQRFTQPYSSIPVLQREGVFKYDLLAGKYRSGISDQGQPSYMQAGLLYGLPRGYTLYGGSQLAADYQAWALGVGLNIGQWGALSLDATHANSTLSDGEKKKGQSLRFLYAKSLLDTGTTFQLLGYRYSTQGFYNLSDVSYRTMSGYDYEVYKDNEKGRTVVPTGYYNLRNTRKGRFQVSINQKVWGGGSLYLSGSQQSYWNTDRQDEYLQAGFTNIYKGINYSLNWSYNKVRNSNGGDKTMSFNVSVPLSIFAGGNQYQKRTIDSIYATSSISHSSNGTVNSNTGISGSMLKDRNLNYSIVQGVSNHNGASGSLNTSYRGTYGNMGAGYNYTANNNSFHYNISGGMIVHEQGVTFGQPLGDTNILIKAQGAKGVKVENKTGIKTDWRGFTYVPYVTPYRNNRVSLDIASLDDRTELEESIQNVVPTHGALVKAEFKANHGMRALFTLKNNYGIPVPFGSSVTSKDGKISGIVSDGGNVYLSGLKEQDELLVSWGSLSEESCQSSYQLNESELNKSIVRKELLCHLGGAK